LTGAAFRFRAACSRCSGPGDGREWPVGWQEWRAAVFGFADRVSDFYAACSPKHVAAEDAAGFAKFVAEWERRRGKLFGGTIHRC
jgi:hypothetical protein